jgi:hypothetical protein
MKCEEAVVPPFSGVPLRELEGDGVRLQDVPDRIEERNDAATENVMHSITTQMISSTSSDGRKTIIRPVHMSLIMAQ